MPIDDLQRKRVLYPHLRRAPRPDPGAVETTVIQTQTSTQILSTGTPATIPTAVFTITGAKVGLALDFSSKQSNLALSATRAHVLTREETLVIPGFSVVATP